MVDPLAFSFRNPRTASDHVVKIFRLDGSWLLDLLDESISPHQDIIHAFTLLLDQDFLDHRYIGIYE